MNKHSMVDHMLANLVLGENGQPAFASTDSAALDFFFRVVPRVSSDELIHLLETAWTEDAATALRLIFQTGNVRELDGGKMDRDNFYRCLLWLWKRHPETLLLNLEAIPQHTCLKDLLSLLAFALHDTIAEKDTTMTLEASLAGKRRAHEHKILIRTKEGKRQRRAAKEERRALLKQAFAFSMEQPLDDLLLLQSPDKVRWVSEQTKEKWLAFIRSRDQALMVQAADEKELRQQKTRKQLRAADTTMGKLFSGVVDIFARGLSAELQTLREDPTALAGLYAKWAPSVDGAHDKATKIVDAIAAQVLVGELADARWGELSEQAATAARRVAYNRCVLSPLRAAAKVPEHFVGKGDWAGVDYDRMPSRCRLLYGERVFAKHDKERYRAFLDEAQKQHEPVGKVKSVKVGALLPHEVTERAWKAWFKLHTAGESDELDDAQMLNQEANLQWRGIVDACKHAARKGEGIGCCVPVCDVSGSMAGEPMEVAIALSLLLAEVNGVETGWHGKIVTFHCEPELVTVFEGDGHHDIGELVHRTRMVGWGGSTDIECTFDLFLANAIANKTTAATLARQAVVIFSDMQWDQCDLSEEPWVTTHETITSKFKNAGYASAPILVYWNLRACKSTPIQKKATPGVLLLAGFSAGLLKSFLAGRLDEFTPTAQLKSVLQLQAYAGLVVAASDCLTA
jgi:hypothetical protein